MATLNRKQCKKPSKPYPSFPLTFMQANTHKCPLYPPTLSRSRTYAITTSPIRCERSNLTRLVEGGWRIWEADILPLNYARIGNQPLRLSPRSSRKPVTADLQVSFVDLFDERHGFSPSWYYLMIICIRLHVRSQRIAGPWTGINHGFHHGPTYHYFVARTKHQWPNRVV